MVIVGKVSDLGSKIKRLVEGFYKDVLSTNRFISRGESEHEAAPYLFEAVRLRYPEYTRQPAPVFKPYTERGAFRCFSPSIRCALLLSVKTIRTSHFTPKW